MHQQSKRLLTSCTTCTSFDGCDVSIYKVQLEQCVPDTILDTIIVTRIKPSRSWLHRLLINLTAKYKANAIGRQITVNFDV